MLVLAAVALPPVGIVLLWLSRGTGLLKKILGSLVIAAWGVGALVLLLGLRAEVDGSGVWPLFHFRRPEHHYAELERDRRLKERQPLAELMVPQDAAPAERTATKATSSNSPAGHVGSAA